MASRAVRTTSLLAMVIMGCGLRAHSAQPALASLVPAPAPANPSVAVDNTIPVAPTMAAPKPAVPWAQALAPLVLKNLNTGAEVSVRLYRDTGELDTDAVAAFALTACDGRFGGKIGTRTVQLAVKAAYHFHASKIIVISAYRPTRRGKPDYHSRGQALDFQLPGVDYRKLASYMRGYPRAGVGVYTNPRTQFVHLDDREVSWHWLDASPPGVTWREAPMADPKRVERDEGYTPDSDLPLPER